MLPRTVGLNLVTIQYLHHLPNGIMNFLSTVRALTYLKILKIHFCSPVINWLLKQLGWCANNTLMIDMLPALDNMEAL